MVVGKCKFKCDAGNTRAPFAAGLVYCAEN